MYFLFHIRVFFFFMYNDFTLASLSCCAQYAQTVRLHALCLNLETQKVLKKRATANSKFFYNEKAFT